MTSLFKMAILSTLTIATIATPLANAQARSHHHHRWDGPRYYDHHHRHRHNNGGNALAAGVIGLAAGAIIASTLSRTSPQPSVIYRQSPHVIYQEPRAIYPARPSYYPAPPGYYPPPPAAYRPIYQPWSPAWYQRCASKYRSFNPQTGTYRGYDGRDHLCRAN
ncbi:BA14K family protein [Bartonella tamiae]|uniref:Lectin-like protein BA14k n=1 Tax=Bartonella tamiae Th239 TaxID=1094558 RepID=J1JW06_9HYPH|nr:BA14K family protein [Bartonella tamiae]EJF89177.1 hypothetical protein ME5_01728 [Bartonella tamiae Th239]EJF95420.1 hypothetical protein MEG_00153 [Bartonella tamiae Th307]